MKTLTIVRSAALSLIALGIVSIASPLSHWHMHHGVRIAALPAVGILCLTLAFYVIKYQRLAAIFGVLTTLFVTGLTLYRSDDYYDPVNLVTVVGIVTLATCLLAAVRLRSTANIRSLRQSYVAVAVVLAVGLLYGVSGMFLLSRHGFHIEHMTVSRAVKTTVEAVTLPDDAISRPTRSARYFIATLNGVGLMVGLTILAALFQPLAYVTKSNRLQRRKALTILQAQATSAEDYLKIWPNDKSYYFSASGASFLAYKIHRSSMVILGDPNGDESEFDTLVSNFFEEMRARHWNIVIVNSEGKNAGAYKKQHVSNVSMGAVAVVRTDSFMANTYRNKHFRYVLNKAKAEQLRVEEWSDCSNEKIEVLRAISNQWLSRGGRREYTFFMGYFDAAYIRSSRIFVLFKDDVAVAYVSLQPSFLDSEASVDQLRSTDLMPLLGMHYLIFCIIKQLEIEKVSSLSLGFAPLSRLDELGLDAPTKRIFELIRRFGTRYYSFKGLEQFKNKFEPEWIPAPMYFTGSMVTLPRVLRDIEGVAKFGDAKEVWVPIISTLGAISTFALIIYISSQ